MVTEVDVATGLVLTVKVAVVAPLGTVTLDGTVATPGLVLERETRAPPLGAGPLNVTVPVEELPPVTLDGLKVRESRVAAWLAGLFISTGTLLESKSPTATDAGLWPAPKVSAARKVPSPLPSSTETMLEPKLATARSGLLSPLKSPTATEKGPLPTPKVCAAPKVPSPLPSSTETTS